jgi:hypothetical protein
VSAPPVPPYQPRARLACHATHPSITPCHAVWPVQRNRTLFLTSVVPIAGKTDTFRVWYGAADANVASMVIQVTHT